MKCVRAGETIQLGKSFKIEFIQSTHSIADSVMVAIHTPVGTIVHTGDFKVDFTPIDGKVMDFARLAELGKQGVLALMSDSTNSEREGFTMSESTVGKVFDNIFADCKKRIVVANLIAQYWDDWIQNLADNIADEQVEFLFTYFFTESRVSNNSSISFSNKI